MKRTRRIEVIRYTRRVAVIEGDAVDRAGDPATDILPEALDDAAPAPEEFRREAGAGRAESPGARLLRRLLRLPRARLPSPLPGGEEARKENEP